MSAIDQIATALNTSDIKAAQQFAEQVRQVCGYQVKYNAIAQALSSVDQQERTVDNVVIYLVGSISDKPRAILDWLSMLLNVSRARARVIIDDYHAEFPLPFTDVEFLQAVQNIKSNQITARRILDQLEYTVIARELSISREDAMELPSMPTLRMGKPVTNEMIILALVELGNQVSEDCLATYFKSKFAIDKLASVLKVLPVKARQIADKIRAEIPLPVTYEDLAEVVRERCVPSSASWQIVQEVEKQVIANTLSISYSEVIEIAPALSYLTQMPVDNHEILLALAALGEDASQTSLLNHLKQKYAPYIELARFLDMEPKEARKTVEAFQRDLPADLTTEDVLRATLNITAGPRTIEKLRTELELSLLVKAFTIGRNQAQTLADTVEQESGYPITFQDILRAHTRWPSTDQRLSVKELSAAWYITNDRDISFHDAVIMLRYIKNLTDGRASEIEVLAAYQASPDKTPAAIASKLRWSLLSRALGIPEDEVQSLQKQITREIGREVALEEIVSVLDEIDGQATSHQVRAWFLQQAKPVLEIAEILQMSPQQARQAIEEIQQTIHHAYSEKEIVQTVFSLSPNDRTIENVIDELYIRQLAEKLGYQTQTLRLLVATITEEIGSKPDYDLLAETVAISQDLKVLPEFHKHPISEDSSPVWIIAWEYQSLAGVITLLQLSKRLDKTPNQLGQLWRDAERQCGKPLELQTFSTLVERLPSSARNATSVTQWLSLADLFHVDPGDDSVIQEFYASFPKKKPTHRFLALCKLYKEVEGASIHDMRYVQTLSSWPQASIDLILPNIDQGEQPITSQILADVGRKHSRRKGNIKGLVNLAQRSWDQICSDKRAYAIPSQGRAEIITSKRIQDMWGLNALRFVQESIDAPKVFVQFKFGEPARIGIMCIEDGETDSGFLMMSEDLWLRAFFRAIALTYYRDLVLPGFTYISSTRLSRSRNSVVDTQSPREQRNVLPRSHTVQREKVYQFYEWHTAQERARHSVTGHVRWVHKGFVADALKHQQAQQAGVQLSLGYTWVVEHERGNPQREDGVALTEDYDLLRHTLFAAPARATTELEALF